MFIKCLHFLFIIIYINVMVDLTKCVLHSAQLSIMKTMFKRFKLSFSALFASFVFSSISFSLSDKREIKELILEATSLFPQRVNFDKIGFEVFNSRLSRGIQIFYSEKWKNEQFKVPLENEDDGQSQELQSIVIVTDKGKDGLVHPSQTNTFVVLLKTLSLDQSTYTAHLAYVRTIDEMKSVEWDVYETRPVLEYKNFFTAVTPTEYFESYPINKNEENLEEKTMDMQKIVKERILRPAFCLMTINMPSWCDKLKFVKNANDGDFNEDDPKQSNESGESSSVKNKKKSIKENQSSILDDVNSFDDFYSSIGQLSYTEDIKKSNSKLKQSHAELGSASEEAGKSVESKESYETQWTKEFNGLINTKILNPEKAIKETGSKIKESYEVSKENFLNNKKGSSSASSENSEINSAEEEESNESNEFSGKDQSSSSEESQKGPGSSSSSLESESMESFEYHNKNRNDDSNKNSNVSHKISNEGFECPPDSGSILLENRCYCPFGTVLSGRKCLNKTLSIEDESEPDNQSKKTNKNKKFKEADAYKLDEIKEKGHKKLQKRESFFAELKEYSHPWLGPFYWDILRVQLIKQKATALMRHVPKKAVALFRDKYRIGNDKVSGHPQFESKKRPITGLMDCPYEEKRFTNFNGSSEENIVDYFLHSLRAQCHRKLRKNILKLFKKRMVSLNVSSHKYIIQLNTSHHFMDSLVLNKTQWQDYISAIYLAKFSEAFTEGKINMDKKLAANLSPDGKQISWTVKTMSVFVEKVLQLLKDEIFLNHAVKITRALVSTLSAFAQRTYKQIFILKMFCKMCKSELETNDIDLQQLKILVNFVINGGGDVANKSLTFDDFYRNQIKQDQEDDLDILNVR